MTRLKDAELTLHGPAGINFEPSNMIQGFWRLNAEEPWRGAGANFPAPTVLDDGRGLQGSGDIAPVWPAEKGNMLGWGTLIRPEADLAPGTYDITYELTATTNLGPTEVNGLITLVVEGKQDPPALAVSQPTIPVLQSGTTDWVEYTVRNTGGATSTGLTGTMRSPRGTSFVRSSGITWQLDGSSGAALPIEATLDSANTGWTLDDRAFHVPAGATAKIRFPLTAQNPLPESGLITDGRFTFTASGAAQVSTDMRYTAKPPAAPDILVTQTAKPELTRGVTGDVEYAITNRGGPGDMGASFTVTAPTETTFAEAALHYRVSNTTNFIVMDGTLSADRKTLSVHSSHFRVSGNGVTTLRVKLTASNVLGTAGESSTGRLVTSGAAMPAQDLPLAYVGKGGKQWFDVQVQEYAGSGNSYTARFRIAGEPGAKVSIRSAGALDAQVWINSTGSVTWSGRVYSSYTYIEWNGTRRATAATYQECLDPTYAATSGRCPAFVSWEVP